MGPGNTKVSDHLGMPGFWAFFVPIQVYFSAFSPIFQGFKIKKKIEAQMPEFSVFFVPILVYFSTFRPPPPFSKGSKFQINEKHKCLVFSHFLFAFWYISRYFSHVFQGLKKINHQCLEFWHFLFPFWSIFRHFPPFSKGSRFQIN